MANLTKGEHQTIRPYLCIKDAAKAIEFYKKAFGAEEISTLSRAGWQDWAFGNPDWYSSILIADEYPEAPEMKGAQPAIARWFLLAHLSPG